MQNLVVVCTTLFFRCSATPAVVESVVYFYHSLRSSLRHPRRSCRMPEKNLRKSGAGPEVRKKFTTGTDVCQAGDTFIGYFRMQLRFN